MCVSHVCYVTMIYCIKINEVYNITTKVTVYATLYLFKCQDKCSSNFSICVVHVFSTSINNTNYM